MTRFAARRSPLHSAFSGGSSSAMALEDGARVGIIGGGPAGSFFALFLLDMAERAELDLSVDIYEPRDFTRSGPAGCNHCGGIVSESLVQHLATEGLGLAQDVVQRGIDSYTLHMDAGTTRIETPLHEKRIAAVSRGAGPRGMDKIRWASFDGFLQRLTAERGAHIHRRRVTGLSLDEGRPRIALQGEVTDPYDLVAVAIGVNTAAFKVLEGLGCGYDAPGTTKAYNCEIPLGEKAVDQRFGTSMHVFLLNLPRLEFAALIPKGEHVTLCLLGEDIDDALVQAVISTPEMRRCLPEGFEIKKELCHCVPKLNIRGSRQPFADRMVMVGDCGVTRLYKDGIGAAYRTAKSAAKTAVFHGVSAEDFRRHHWPTCRALARDNRVGKFIFGFTRLIQGRAFARRAIMRMVQREQSSSGPRRMSLVLWDMFTGSAPYREILMRTLHPAFILSLIRHTAGAILFPHPLKTGGSHHEQRLPGQGISSG